MKRLWGRKHLDYGRIIWARVVDRNGFIKQRPAVIVSNPTNTAKDEPLVVVAITTTFPDPPPEWHVLLPWNPDGRRVATELSSRSAAVVGWFDTIRSDDVIELRGIVPAKQMRRIEELIRLWHAAQGLGEDQFDVD